MQAVKPSAAEEAPQSNVTDLPAARAERRRQAALARKAKAKAEQPPKGAPDEADKVWLEAPEITTFKAEQLIHQQMGADFLMMLGALGYPVPKLKGQGKVEVPLEVEIPIIRYRLTTPGAMVKPGQ